MDQKFAVFGTLSQTFDAFRAKFLPLLGWSILPILALLAVLTILGAVFGGSFIAFIASLPYFMQTGNTGFLAFGGGVILSLILMLLVIILFSAWYEIYAARLGTQALRGEILQPGDARKRGFSRMLSSLLISIVVMIAYVVIFVIAGLVLGFFASFGAFGAVFSFILGIGLFVAFIYVMIGLVAVTPVMANEGLGLSAITRSWEMVKGNRWQLIGYNLMWVLIFIGIYLIFLLYVLIASLFFAASVAFGIALFAIGYLVFLGCMTVFGTLIGPSIYVGLLSTETA